MPALTVWRHRHYAASPLTTSRQKIFFSWQFPKIKTELFIHREGFGSISPLFPDSKTLIMLIKMWLYGSLPYNNQSAKLSLGSIYVKIFQVFFGLKNRAYSFENQLVRVQ